jgi:hypothetical protein
MYNKLGESRLGKLCDVLDMQGQRMLNDEYAVLGYSCDPRIVQPVACTINILNINDASRVLNKLIHILEHH